MEIHSLLKIAEDFSIDLIFLFGSQKENGNRILKGEDIEIEDLLTDLDIGVVFKKGFLPRKPYEIFGPLYFELAEVFHPLKPDLIFLEKTDSTFQFEAINGICIFNTDMEILENYIEKVLIYAADWKVFRDRIDHDFLSMIRDEMRRSILKALPDFRKNFIPGNGSHTSRHNSASLRLATFIHSLSMSSDTGFNVRSRESITIAYQQELL